METDFKEFEEAQKMVWDILYDVGIYFDFNAYNIYNIYSFLLHYF